MIDRDTLTTLLADADPAVSVYLPVDPAQHDPRAAAAGLDDTLGELEGMLTASAGDRAPALMEQVRTLAETPDPARHRAPGLALFAGNVPTRLELPHAPARAVVVARHFHVRPLLPMLALRQRFHVLALSSGRVRLIDMTPFDWHERLLDALPPDVQAELDSLPAAENRRDEAAETLLLQSLHRVATAVKAALADQVAPVLLIAEPHVGGQFRKLAGSLLPQLEPQMLALNPHAFPDAELHRRAVGAMRHLFDADLLAALDQVNARLGTAEPTVSLRLEEILAAAEAARVETLVVNRDATLWGRSEPGHKPSAHGHQVAGDEDLLNRAAVLSLRNGARVLVAPPESMPRQAGIAATFRY